MMMLTAHLLLMSFQPGTSTPESLYEGYCKAVLARQSYYRTVQAQVSGTDFTPQGLFSNDPSTPAEKRHLPLPAQDETTKYFAELLLDLESQRINKREERMLFNMSRSRMSRDNHHYYYDGHEFWTNCYTHYLSSGNTGTDSLLTARDYPLLWACGWAQFDTLALHSKPVRGDPRGGIVDYMSADGVTLRLRGQAQKGHLGVVLLVDSRVDYLPTRCELWLGDKLYAILQCSWRLQDQTFVPDSWDFTNMANGNISGRATRMVDSWKANPPVTIANFRPTDTDNKELHDYRNGEFMIVPAFSWFSWPFLLVYALAASGFVVAFWFWVRRISRRELSNA